jgi:hypothetical protein
MRHNPRSSDGRACATGLIEHCRVPRGCAQRMPLGGEPPAPRGCAMQGGLSCHFKVGYAVAFLGEGDWSAP